MEQAAVMSMARAKDAEAMAAFLASDENARGAFLQSWRFWSQAEDSARGMYERLLSGGLTAVRDEEVASLYFLDARSARRAGSRTNALRSFEAVRQRSWKGIHDALKAETGDRIEKLERELLEARRALEVEKKERREILRKERIVMEAEVRGSVRDAVVAEQGARTRAAEGVRDLMGGVTPPGDRLP